MKLSKFSQFKNNTSRFHNIISILTKYGLANWIQKEDPSFLKNLVTNAQGDTLAGLPFEERFRMALTELGTTFIKLGQILSTRADLIGPELATELTKLQSDTPIDSPEQVTTMIESELGQSMSELFLEFDFTPVGSASIGQVHKAVLQDGSVVVVKVQHSDIEDKILADIEILALLATLSEKYDKELSLYQPKSLIEDFSESLFKELDYGKELRNMALFSQQFLNNPKVKIPITYPEFSSKRVLTMECLNGFSIAEADKLKANGVNTKEIAALGVNIYLDMVFQHHIFHADPHPGNIWVLDDDRIGLLDFGMIGRIDDNIQEALELMLLAASEKNSVDFTKQVIRVCTLPESFDKSKLQRDIDEFLHEYLSQPMASLNISEILNTMNTIIRKHRLLMPSGISMLIRVLVMLEGSSQRLDRDFSVNDAIEPYTKKMKRARLSPRRFSKKLGKSYFVWERLLTTLPDDVETLISKMRSGSFDVNLKHRHLDAVVNRLVYGILSGAIFLGGSMMLSSSVPPLMHGISILGAVITSVGSVLCYNLLTAIRKSGSLTNTE
ncbi:AarF/ABC1/UbiB kinase family protein [Colwellia sp. E2M01]|uniref:ABC1 kinase family protein n=1 Tax=Colwellia sp. E2M01 TaxID=2841561 RepID=UPI001C088526|nr:AarF/ABC1/UbiB kinase family protein [Colwellia sp. E2M01]MBU2870398.1 AarF/ABC1/UbiB kinase family protein [Colwellia sp. E2M01]